MKKILFLALLGLNQIVFSQNVEFKSANFKDQKEAFKKAEDAISAGDVFFNTANDALAMVKDYGDNYQQAMKNYQIAQAFNPNNGLLNFKIGACLANSNNPGLAIPYINKAKSLDPTCDPYLNYYNGVCLQLQGKFDEAVKSYTAFNTEYKKSEEFSKFVAQCIAQCALNKKSIAKPVRCWVDNMEILNTSYDDISPTISTDGAEMILSSNRSNDHTANEFGEFDYDVYSSSLGSAGWSAPVKLKGGVNTVSDDISDCLYFDGTKMLIHRNDGTQSDIYESHLLGANWTDPTKLNANISNERMNERYACYNEDGYRLYFNRATDRETSTSGYDVVFSAVQSIMIGDFKTAAPVLPVNSRFNEGPIYITVDGETMYIASEGHESLGGYDIFISKKEQGIWTTPVNMGFPINTPYDDFFFASTANGKFAYISSNREGGKGGYDIYRVTFWGPEKKPVTETEDYLLASIAQPVKDHAIESSVDVKKKSLTVFKGVTIDAISRKPVEAEIEITDNATGKIIETFKTNSATGKFIITLASGKNYGIAVKATGYLFHSENFDIPAGSDDNLVNKTIELKNIAVGSKIALRNIFFDYSKSTLRSESNAELERLVKLMKDVPNLKIEISGHTDNTGSATFNETLSQQRAEAVVTYLTSKGIAANRMVAKGYGSSKPVAANNSEDGRQQNRRTEFEIKGN